MNKPKILIVEDDKDIANLLKINLENNDYLTHIVYNGKDAVDYFNTSNADLVILDIMLPEVNGLDIIKVIRYEKGLKALPIIVVSAKTDESDIVTALELGADDYLPKPFSSKILLVKVKALLKKQDELKQHSFDNKDTINIDGITFDNKRHIVLKDGKELTLTATEFTLLGTLLSDVGRTFSREQLMDSTKGGEYYSLERTIDVQIAMLRKKLGDKGNYIKTVWGVGYRWENREIN